MNVLVTGASGFIGGHIVRRLLGEGHQVVGTARAPVTDASFEIRQVDFRHAKSVGDWRRHLGGMDAVINCAGILQGRDIWSVHFHAAKALFDACAAEGVSRVIQISALSADAAAGTAYAASKKAADDYLRGLELDWVILRPSLVIAEGSYGGTSTLRGLAGLPTPVIPVVGSPDCAFQPLHVEDLAAGVAWLLAHPEVSRIVLEPAGPEKVTLPALVTRYRAWLGFPPAPILHLPKPLQRMIAKLGDLFGVAAINTTSLRQLEYGNTTESDWTGVVRIRCRSFGETLASRPALVQDRWHARLYFLKPAMRVAMILLWAGSAVAGAMAPPDLITGLAGAIPEPEIVRWTTVALDTAIAGWLVSGQNLRRCYAVQFWVITLYTVTLTVIAPSLWGAPLGELLKNLPILVLAAVAWAIADER